MARFFENSLDELSTWNGSIETRFKRIDTRHFTAIVYRDGRATARCKIWLGDNRGFVGGIAYSTNEDGGDNSFNESLSIESDDQHLYLRALGMPMQSIPGDKGHLTFEGAAEYYWALFIEPLQR